MRTDPDITPELIEALRDPATRDAGFDLLAERCIRPLYRHARRIVAVHEDAEDVVQETFVRAYDRIGSFRGGAGELRVWLWRIATRAALTALRRRRRHPFASLDEVSRELAGRMEELCGPDADRELVRFRQAVMELPLRQRLVFDLRYREERSYREIAEVLGGRAETHRVNYHHAVETLKKRLKCEL